MERDHRSPTKCRARSRQPHAAGIRGYSVGLVLLTLVRHSRVWAGGNNKVELSAVFRIKRRLDTGCVSTHMSELCMQVAYGNDAEASPLLPRGDSIRNGD